jgi:hypothetical protein
MNESHESVADITTQRRLRSREIEMARVGTLIAQGYTLPAIARKRGRPDIETLRHWLAENDTLRDAYDKASDLRNELLADDAIVLADALADANNAGLKLRIDARKWRAALNRKDKKKNGRNDGPPPDLAERIQRANERAEKYRLEQEKKLRAQIAVELSQRHGFALDQETIDAAKDDNPFTFNDERDGDGVSDDGRRGDP